MHHKFLPYEAEEPEVNGTIKSSAARLSNVLVCLSFLFPSDVFCWNFEYFRHHIVTFKLFELIAFLLLNFSQLFEQLTNKYFFKSTYISTFFMENQLNVPLIFLTTTFTDDHFTRICIPILLDSILLTRIDHIIHCDYTKFTLNQCGRT